MLTPNVSLHYVLQAKETVRLHDVLCEQIVCAFVIYDNVYAQEIEFKL